MGSITPTGRKRGRNLGGVEPAQTEMMLSIVSTLYASEQHVAEFCERSRIVARSVAGDDYQIILVNDGSPDASLALALDEAADDVHLTVVDLSRNFGHHKAMMTGLSYATGRYVFLLDSDLEEEPEWLSSFFNQMKEDNCDVVYGVQQSRKGGIFERWSGEWFYRLFNAISGLGIPRNITVARLMTHQYVNALLQHREREIFIAGLWQITGFDQRSQIISKHSASKTTYTMRRKFSHLVNSITSFSSAPLRIIFYIGAIISILSSAFISYVVIQTLFFSHPLAGWASLMASIWFLGGLIISFVGLIGIYLSKIFSEVKERPYTLVRAIYSDGGQKVNE